MKERTILVGKVRIAIFKIDPQAKPKVLTILANNFEKGRYSESRPGLNFKEGFLILRETGETAQQRQTLQKSV